MQKVKVFDLKERSLLFSLEIIKFLGSLPTGYISNTIGKQLLRSATSIGANIVEAQSAPSRRDFANFYNIALKSANETKYWLAVLRRSDICTEGSVSELQNEVDEVARIIAKSILTVRGK